MVTAKEGRRNRTIRKPLSAPQRAPAKRQITIASGIASLYSQSNPSRELESPSMDATERSISLVITIRLNGRAIRAISTKFASRLDQFSTVRKSLLRSIPPTTAINTRTARMVSQLSSTGQSSCARLALTHT